MQVTGIIRSVDGDCFYQSLEFVLLKKILTPSMSQVHIMNRDCGVSSHLGDPLACVSAGTCAYSAIGNLLDSAIDTVTTVLNGDVLQGAVVIKKWDAEKVCVPCYLYSQVFVTN